MLRRPRRNRKSIAIREMNTGDESDLWGHFSGNVIRAMSLVPDAVRSLQELSAAHYLALKDVRDPNARMPALERPQVELIAGRISALNECFY